MFIIEDEEQAWVHVVRLRRELITYLRGLNEKAWDEASLCEGWRVRDVVAHLIIEYRYTFRGAWRQFMRSGFNANRFLQQTAIISGDRPISVILADLESLVHERRVPKGGSIANVIADLLIHEQDIRRALGQQKAMPLTPLRYIFENWVPQRFNIGERLVGVARRIKDLQFTATDIDVTKGKGLPVLGKAEDILFAISGRRVAPKSLSGDGANILMNR